jgi:hypothetical protein
VRSTSSARWKAAGTEAAPATAVVQLAATLQRRLGYVTDQHMS